MGSPVPPADARSQGPVGDPVESDRLRALAQEAADQRWAVYEGMATRGAGTFPADPRKASR
jgi:pyruvate-ferredoxin/flavodoxin oxidoreductase